MLLFDPAKLGHVSAEAHQDDPAPGPATLDAFLAGIDARAFRFAEIALRNRDDALDAVQDAMMKMLAYRDRAPSEWSPLFWSILRNRIVDLQRRGLFRLRWLVPGSSNDDGEPGGTAGRPILAAIEAQDCDQVAVLVIRWYGGIQLGTGGLARAYGGGANKCLQAAPKIELISRVPLSCACAFGELALVKLRVAELGGLVVEESFTANGVDLKLALGEAQIETLQLQLADLSRGRILLER